MDDQQKELMDNWNTDKEVVFNIDDFGDVKGPSNDDDIYWGNLPPELVYPYSYKLTLKNDCSTYEGIKIGAWVEMKDDKNYCCGEVTKIEGNSFWIACNIVPLKEKDSVNEMYKERRERAMKHDDRDFN
ncbi:hypothetical protein ACTQ4M_01060 [Lactobacillus amylovorus]|uniref:hypothetical protein n=1 Tax=Lactobacillus amylovorus TaxID=1604 RepID=UPI003F9E9E3E